MKKLIAGAILLIITVCYCYFVLGMMVFSKSNPQFPKPPTDYTIVNVDGKIVWDAQGRKYRLNQVEGHYHLVRRVK